MYVVKYDGFLQRVERRFETKVAAILWCRQVGVLRVATIEKEEV